MRFLVDAQLPPDLAGFLMSCGYEALHVAEIGLFSAEDMQIWERAQTGGFVIVTKDAISPPYTRFVARHRKSSGCVSAILGKLNCESGSRRSCLV